MQPIPLLFSLAGVALLAGLASPAQAQITFGPRVGVNFANFSYRTESLSIPNTRMYAGLQVGVAASVGLGQNLTLQPAVLLSQKGYRLESNTPLSPIVTRHRSSLRLNYLEIPLNFVYTSGGQQGLQVFAGPYVGAGLSGHYHRSVQVQTGSTTISNEREAEVEFAAKRGEDSEKEYHSRLEAGATVGAGYKAGPAQVQVGYSLGLTNLTPRSASNQKPIEQTFNRVLHVQATYFFGGK